ncbi:MAG: SRPBCC domain-containing protein [Ignavibacteria bacterium]|nr:SRPBCC domain-containing protein [Ignavibacteria bacterium]
MTKEPLVKKMITVQASRTKVWEALTRPELTRKYMFGSDVVSDWRVGSPIIWKGVVDGNERVFVKGEVKSIEHERLLEYTVFAPNSGIEDMPSNYTTVRCELSSSENHTTITITQGDFSTIAGGEKRYADTLGGWDFALNGLKRLVESE